MILQLRLFVTFLFLLALAGLTGVKALASSLTGGTLEPPGELTPLAEHADQAVYLELVKAGQHEDAFILSFEEGDELFETRFNAADGVGAHVGDGQRFTRVPRADLDGEGEWAAHVPARSTGPNAQACNSCHNEPMDDGAGLATNNVHRDPQHSGSMDRFITRNTPHLFGLGATQRLAEEMTDELREQRQVAITSACSGQVDSVQQPLVTKGVSFGALEVQVLEREPCRFRIDMASLTGIDEDLVVRPFHWKGRDASLRAFNRDASHNELGMQAVELVGEGVDGDGDGVTDELSVGDQTALVIYLAAQPRPATRLELDALGQIEPLSEAERTTISTGERLFAESGCAGCHVPQLELEDPVYREPSQSTHFRDAAFAGDTHPENYGIDPEFPVSFDLTRDHPDNIIEDDEGEVHRIGSFESTDDGGAIVRLYSDLKRHDMGPELSERIDETGVGASVWLTRSLWGVGSTAPYLHDGRATSLAEAIDAHGGEAEASREQYHALGEAEQGAVIAFLQNLVLFKLEEEETHQ